MELALVVGPFLTLPQGSIFQLERKVNRMSEPCLMTEQQYFASWEKYNPLSRPYNEVQELLFACILVFGINGIFAANAYGTGHSRSGPLLMIFFFVVFAICLLLSTCIQERKRRRFELWEQYFPYDPERSFSTDHFEKESR